MPGDPTLLGVTPNAQGVNVAVVSAHATAIEFCVFDETGTTERARIALPNRQGDVFHAQIAGIGVGTRYGLRAHGRFAPNEGHWFNPAKLLIDPYALALDRILKLDPAMFGLGAEGMDPTDSAAAMPKGIVIAPPEPAPALPINRWAETVIIELHVRGFTMRHPDVPETLRGTFGGLAHPAAIAHLKALGVTAVEIMPPAAWMGERHLAARGADNYWGYNTAGFLCPDPRLAPGGWAEVRACVASLAAAGIETLVDIVLNHTGEGDIAGPTLSLRGLDNATYFRAEPGTPWRYANDTGCGNTLALHRPAPLRLAMDCLRAWANYGGVHGFRFDLATVLGRTETGYDPNAPLLQAIGQDPVLSRLKMIAEPWDIGPCGYQLGHFPPAWGEWNDRFRDEVRSFWRGDPGRLGAIATRLAGSADLFNPHRGPSRSVNFITAHDGFTLADLVAYTHKRNDANGEDNRDGTDDNRSWNNGVEGPTDDPAIRAARLADQRALLASLLLARGTPMLSMGSEFGQTQGGNNNPYAQDNETSWLNWAEADPDLLAWTQQLIALRRTHPALREDRFLTGAVCGPHLLPDVLWRRTDGAAMTPEDWNAPQGDTLVMQLGADRPLCLILHRGTAPVEIALPQPGDGRVWRLLADSAAPAPPRDLDTHAITAHRRSVLVLAEHDRPTPRRATDPALLDRLTRAAGISGAWWETGGTHHRVSDDTKRAVLRAMDLPAETSGAARDSLIRLADGRDRRPLPAALVRRVDTEAILPMNLADGALPRSTWLIAELETGETLRLPARLSDAQIVPGHAADGRASRRWMLPLPHLPIGRHRVWREDAPAHVCTITIAPRSCFLPPPLRDGARRFGLSAQLYTLRSARDQGIGDFTTLRGLAQRTSAAGGSVLGLNPMHTLFAGDRGRASPYQPSDRRFLDPIYLDLPECDGPTARALSALPAVDYPAVWALKAPSLAARFAQDGTHANPEFTRFIAAGGADLHRFAVFEALAEAHPGQSWRDWPEPLRHPDTPAVADFAKAHAARIRFHQYLQFLCDQQLGAATGALEIGFIRDLAVGCARDGGEAWAMGKAVAQGISIGAPPDPFSAEGQVWGLPPPNPHAMAEGGYAAFAGLLAANMRHAGGLRIDHALGLQRLFWVPEGAAGADGTYVAYPFEDLLGQIALESHRAHALVIGEDLGTVPDGLRAALTVDDILSYRVLLLEREGIAFRPARSYPRRAVACVSTHDLPTFAGWLDGADIAERRNLGQIPPETAAAEHHTRAAEAAELRAALGPRTGDTITDAHAFVAETKSDLVFVQADDLAGERQAVNLPGTDQERPNWRRRLSVPLDDLFETPTAGPILASLRGTRPS